MAAGAGSMCQTRPGLGFLHPALKTESDRSSHSFLRTLDSTATAPWDTREKKKSACLLGGLGLTPYVTFSTITTGSSSSRLFPLQGWWGRGFCAGVRWPQLGAEHIQLPPLLPMGSVPTRCSATQAQQQQHVV